MNSNPGAARVFSKLVPLLFALGAATGCMAEGLDEGETDALEGDALEAFDEPADADAERVDEASSALSMPTGCADPGVMPHAGKFYLVCTGDDANGTFPIYVSNDGSKWERSGRNVFPHAQPAGQSGTTSKSHPWGKGKWWAPELHHVEGGFVAVYSALDARGKLAVGAAYATSPLGPYTEGRAEPLAAPSYSVIDAHMFKSGGKNYLYYKRNENGKSTAIVVQKMDATGRKKEGAPKAVLDFGTSKGSGWEGKLVEAPWVVKRGKYFYLFYAANYFCNEKYATGVARSKSPMGPFKKLGKPVISSGKRWKGPGHASIVFGTSGTSWMYLHAYDSHEKSPSCQDLKNNPARHLRRYDLSFKSGWPKLVDTSKKPTGSCQLRCCDGTLQTTKAASEDACRDDWTACKDHGYTLRIRYKSELIYDKKTCG